MLCSLPAVWEWKLLTVVSPCYFVFFFSVSDVKVPLLPSHKRMDITVFKPFIDLDTQPVLFIPDVHFASLQRGAHVGNPDPRVAARRRQAPEGESLANRSQSLVRSAQD